MRVINIILILTVGILQLHAKSIKPAFNEDYVYQSYQTSIYCTPSSPMQYPHNAEEMQSIIRDAISNDQTVKVIGSRHSITDVICTDGIPISTKNLNYARVNTEDNTATFGSGMHLKEALEFLHEAGLSLEHVPTFGGISIGGAIGTGAHGSTLRHSAALSDQIVSATVIDGEGNLRIVTDYDDIRALGVHLGLLGALVDVTLRTVPLFKMTVEHTLRSEDILLDGTVLAEAYHHDMYQLWWFPQTKSVVVSMGDYVDVNVAGEAETNLIPDLKAAQISITHYILEMLQASKLKLLEYAMEAYSKVSLYTHVLGKPPVLAETTSGGLKKFVNPATGYAHRLMASYCGNNSDVCTWDNGDESIYPEESAMAFEVSKLPAVIRSIRGVLKEYPAAFSMIGVYVRFTRASENLMSIGYGRDNVHLEWTTPMRKDPFTKSRSNIGAYQAILQAMHNEHGGRAHWGKNGAHFFQTSTLQTMVPNVDRFKTAMKKFDPNGLFLNKFGRRLLGTSEELTVHPKVKHCALQDYCMCTKDTDCGEAQICTLINGKYNVCRDRREVPCRLENDVLGLETLSPKNFTRFMDALMLGFSMM